MSMSITWNFHKPWNKQSLHQTIFSLIALLRFKQQFSLVVGEFPLKRLSAEGWRSYEATREWMPDRRHCHIKQALTSQRGHTTDPAVARNWCWRHQSDPADTGRGCCIMQLAKVWAKWGFCDPTPLLLSPLRPLFCLRLHVFFRIIVWSPSSLSA